MDEIADHDAHIAVAAGLTAPKTGVTFRPRRPLPADLVERLVLTSWEDLGV